MHTPKILIALVLFPLALRAQSDSNQEMPPASSPPPEAAPAEARRELAAKQAELTEVTEQITALQRRAEDNEVVEAAKDEYRETLRTEMVQTAPELAPAIDRQAALVDELTATPAPDAEASPDAPSAAASETEDREAKLQEYRALHQQLAPVEQSVQSVPAVQTARKAYYDALMAEMQRLEPQTSDLLAKHRELTAVIRELAAQAQTG